MRFTGSMRCPANRRTPTDTVRGHPTAGCGTMMESLHEMHRSSGEKMKNTTTGTTPLYLSPCRQRQGAQPEEATRGPSYHSTGAAQILSLHSGTVAGAALEPSRRSVGAHVGALGAPLTVERPPRQPLVALQRPCSADGSAHTARGGHQGSRATRYASQSSSMPPPVIWAAPARYADAVPSPTRNSQGGEDIFPSPPKLQASTRSL